MKLEIFLVLLALSVSSVLCKPSEGLMAVDNAMLPMIEPVAPSGSAADYYYYDYGCNDYDYEYVEDMGSGPIVDAVPIITIP
ncbi:unnamed protein product [Diamesa hyperborea]